jgi:hypothetical protein
MLDSADVLPIVVECTEDPGCPVRVLFLRSLYCTVGHLQFEDRPRVRAVAEAARASADPAVRTWATRAVAVIDGVQVLNRSDWCGSPSLAVTNPIEF